jgi:hypothetical protein
MIPTRSSVLAFASTSAQNVRVLGVLVGLSAVFILGPPGRSDTMRESIIVLHTSKRHSRDGATCDRGTRRSSSALQLLKDADPVHDLPVSAERSPSKSRPVTLGIVTVLCEAEKTGQIAQVRAHPAPR